MSKQINVGCNGLIIKDNKLLMGLRKNIYGDGTYGLPGGHLEFGEKLIEAAKREMKEELGINAADLELISITDSISPEHHYIQVNFLIKDFQGEIICKEPEACAGWDWLDLNNLPDNIFPPHANIVKALKDKKMYLV